MADRLASMFLPAEAPIPTMRFGDVLARGRVEQGNIDLLQRPTVHNPDGSISTLLSMSFDDNGKEVLIPRVSPSGVVLSEPAAIALYRATGKHLGKFNEISAADEFAERLHQQQEQLYGR